MTEPSPELVELLVAAAVRAPSSHNTQPWLFEASDGELRLRADRTRALPINDPHDRELTISCGAALFNLEVAAREHGYTPELALLPEADDPDLLARVGLRRTPGEPGDPLFPAIARRRTTREPFAATELSADLVERLRSVAAQHGVTAHVIGGDARGRLADLVAEGDRRQFADPRWRRELAGWMHTRRKGDGLVVPELFGLVTKAVVTAFDVGKLPANDDHELLIAAPLVLVLATPRDDPRTWLDVGRALEHMLLTAASDDVMAGYLNQPCQLDGLRGRLAELLPEPCSPQLVVRLGFPRKPVRQSPRRPIAAVTRY